MSLYDKIFRPKEYKLPNGKTVSQKRSRAPFIWAAIIAMTILSVKVTGFNFAILSQNMGNFWSMLGSMFPPDTKYMAKVWGPLMDTIKMSLIGSFIGSVVVIPFAFLASSNIVRSRVVNVITKLFLSIVRTLPTLVIALVATNIWGLGTIAGSIAIGVFSFAYIGKILYEEIETADMGSFEAMEAMGCTKPQAFMKAIIPQVMPTYLSQSLFNFEGNVRYAAILGYIGAGGLGLILNERVAWRAYPSVGMILVALYITVFIIETISRAIRKRLV
ncbi:MAG: phosphonate ABC transporter, permease protein PhnE [Lachnospiraceae bacterium]|nr:phosphonate ABC transporter, permease protein PhnE [Lachnospiraceae bacterium]